MGFIGEYARGAGGFEDGGFDCTRELVDLKLLFDMRFFNAVVAK